MNALLAQLDRRLDRRGEIIWIDRSAGTGNNAWVRAKVPAFVQALTREQLIGSITQQNLFIIISPTHLFEREKWPGGLVPNAPSFGIIAPTDKRFPTTNDKAWVRGPQRAITNCKPVFDGAVCIRIEMTCLG